MGTVLNGLSHMHGVTNRAEFAVALIRGLGGNLKDSAREALAKEVLGWVGESIPSGENRDGGELIFRILNFFSIFAILE